MSKPSIKLYRLRGWFVIYYLLKSVVGAVVVFSILRPLAIGHYGLRGWSPGSLAAFSLLVAAVILAVAMLIFGQLLLRKNWARVLLLVIAWLTVVSAVFGLLASTQISTMGSWIAQWLPNMDWEKLMQYDRVQKVFELLFWGYLISVLQFDAEVKKEFFPPPPADEAGK